MDADPAPVEADIRLENMQIFSAVDVELEPGRETGELADELERRMAGENARERAERAERLGLVRMLPDDGVRAPELMAMIFGTPTTIQENSHKQALTALGIHPDRIITQGCLNLAGKIERDPFGPEVARMIDENAGRAGEKSGKGPGKLYAALCCTHFGGS